MDRRFPLQEGILLFFNPLFLSGGIYTTLHPELLGDNGFHPINCRALPRRNTDLTSSFGLRNDFFRNFATFKHHLPNHEVSGLDRKSVV